MTPSGDSTELFIGSPTVILLRDTFRMYYASSDSSGRGWIRYAYSTDGLNWEKFPIPVLEPDDSSWDGKFLDTPEIIHDDGGFKLYYFGDTDNNPQGGSIGIAISSDGIHWSRPLEQPVLNPGQPGEWDGLFIESPSVVYDSSNHTYFMYYSGVDSTWRVRIGGAFSTDGINWSKFPENPILTEGAPWEWDGFSVATPSVIKRDTLFEMWYCGASVRDFMEDGRIDTLWIGYATSTDGIHWRKFDGNPLFGTYTSPFKPEEIRGPWAPDVVFISGQGEFKMWYETAYGFGLATSRTTFTGERNFEIEDTLEIYSINGRKLDRIKENSLIILKILTKDGAIKFIPTIGRK